MLLFRSGATLLAALLAVGMDSEFTTRMYGVLVGTTVAALLYANCVFVAFRGGHTAIGVLLGLLSAELLWAWGSLIYHWKWGRIARGASVQCTALFGCLRLVVVPPSDETPRGRLEFRAFRRVDVFGDATVVARVHPTPVPTRTAARKWSHRRKQHGARN